MIHWPNGKSVHQETRVQSQVESYQRLKKCYLMPTCLTLSIIKNGPGVKWSNSGKGVTPFPTPRCRETSGRPRQQPASYIYIYICVCGGAFIYIYA